MKIIEALKKIRLLSKKMHGNNADIQKYASGVTTEKPYFESAKAQESIIKHTEQSSLDLWREQVRLEMAVVLTNILTVVSVNGKEYTLFELLKLKRKGGDALQGIYQAMNETAGQQKMRFAQQMSSGDPVHIVRFYDEAYKNEKLRELQDLIHEADSRLEVINATEELVNLDTIIQTLKEYFAPKS